jgi:ubiquinone/menaquinone biosynthesis C-methylase UbiE
MSAPNKEQIDFWNSTAAAVWVESQTRMDKMLAPLTEVALSAAAVHSGERVIDVGCGCGDTSLQLGQAGAAVWGIDISAAMLTRAKERAVELALEKVRFSQTDAATQTLTADHDLIFSRFGIMFFDDPIAALSNLRTGLKPGGRLCFVCWQPPRRNLWMSTAGAAIQPFLPPPESPPDPRAPGPFAFADKDYLAGVLDQAGFKDTRIESVERSMHLADTLDEAMEMQARVGPVARALSELEGEPLEQALAAARAALGEHVSSDGINLGAAVWLVRAQHRE